MSTVIALIGIILLLVAALIALPAGVLFVQLAAAALRREPAVQALHADPGRGTLAVLMPAHDEAIGITAAIEAVRAQHGPRRG
ncbi:MAG: hypothetical protein H7Y61_11640, partial [Rhizobiales bacterium]|nr:hypothetical protein [Rhizobacter sp.]